MSSTIIKKEDKMNYLSIDVGTTGCKCQLFSETGEILKYLFNEYDFKEIDGSSYVDIHAVEAHLRNMISDISKDFYITSVCISSLGESFVVLDEDDHILFYPMLYTDNRGENEAEEIKAENKIFVFMILIKNTVLRYRRRDEFFESALCTL